MPTYDYECDACGHTWELFQPITADPVTKCPTCGKKKARRLFGTGAALMFKGSGFYETDYRSDSYNKSKQADEKSRNGSSGTSSDSKPDSSSKSSDKGPSAESKPDSSSSSEGKSSEPSNQSTGSKASRTARKPQSGAPAKKGKKKS